MIPTRKIGRIESSKIQYGWWKAGGPPYFKRPSIQSIIDVRKCLLEHRVTSDNAPAYAKGLTEMEMWLGYSYLEEWWIESGRTTRMADDVVFSKCGLYWPRESRQNTHGDMHKNIDKLLGKKASEVKPSDVEMVVLGEFEQSCIRMHVDFIHGYMLHWPLAREGSEEPEMPWILDGVLPAFAKLYKQGRTGAIGFGNVPDTAFIKALDAKCAELSKQMDLKDFHVHYIQNSCSLMDLGNESQTPASLISGELAEYCVKNNVARVAYSALGHGAPIAPAGDFIYVDHWGIPEEKQCRLHAFRAEFHKRYAAIAAKAGCSATQLALAWLIEQDIIPLFSSMSPHHIEENLKSFDFTGKVAEMRAELAAFFSQFRREEAEMINNP